MLKTTIEDQRPCETNCWVRVEGYTSSNLAVRTEDCVKCSREVSSRSVAACAKVVQRDGFAVKS